MQLIYISGSASHSSNCLSVYAEEHINNYFREKGPLLGALFGN